jgi:hypothetical protein
LHSRGNFEGFVRSASKNKWLEVNHWRLALGRRFIPIMLERLLHEKFFDFYLKGKKNGWDKTAPLPLCKPEVQEKKFL